MYLMEHVLGQFSGKGPSAVWDMNPSAKGIGISMILASIVFAIYYNVIMAYTLFFFSSKQDTLPWTVCKPEWKQYGCVEQTTRKLKYCNDTVVIKNNITDCRCTLDADFDSSLPFNCTITSYYGEPTSSEEMFFYKEVIQKSANLYLEDVGAPIWKLALCLLLSWTVVVLCLIKGVKSSGKDMALPLLLNPEALTNVPLSQLWSVLFFFMFFTLGLDSEFAILETVLTCLQDEFPQLRKYKSYMCVGFGIGCYLIALPCITPAGDYIVTLMDSYGADFSVLFVATCESIAVMWVCGVKRFIGDVTYMLGRAPRPVYFWGFCWVFCAPNLIGLLFVYRLVEYRPPKINDNLEYPEFAQFIGWAFTCFVLCPIPLTFLNMLFTANGSLRQRLKTITTPTPRWGTNDGSKRDKYWLDDIDSISDEEQVIDNPVISSPV